MNVALRAVQIAGEFATVDGDASIPDFQRGFERFDDAGAILIGKQHGILDDFQRVAAFFDLVIALLGQKFANFGLGEVLRNRHGKRDEQFALGPGKLLVDRIRRVAADGFAAVSAIELRRAREEKFQMVVQFRHRADGGARGFDGIGLVDGDGGRDAVDAVGFRLVHAVEELAGVGRKRLDVAALSLGVDRVERQG